MDPRFDRAHGAMAGLIYGRSLGVDTSGEESTDAASVCKAILELLTVDKSAEPPTLPSLLAPTKHPYALLIGGVQVGISTPTKGPQVFADAVWNNHLMVEPTRQQFQASALVAAAVSLGLDSPHFRVADVLVKAVDVVSSLEERGEWSPEPNVVAATRRALNIVSDMNEYVESPLERLLEHIGAGDSLSQIVPMAFALASRYQNPHLLASPLHLGPQAHTILSVAGALVGAVRGVSFLRPYGYPLVEEVFTQDFKQSAHDLLAKRVPYPGDARASDTAAPSGPSSFEDDNSGQRTRQRYFEPLNPPMPLKALRGDSQRGRVVFLGELFADHLMHAHKYPKLGEHVWASDQGRTAGGMFRAMAAARHMGAEVVSLGPIGQGPNARIITQAMRRMNIVNAGPHLSGVDNGYRLQFSADEGYRMIPRGTPNNGWFLTLSTRSPKPSAASRGWSEAIESLGPSDVLWIDGTLMGDDTTAQALNEALRGVPEHVRVVFDGASDEGIPTNLPLDNVLVSLRIDNHATFSKHFNAAPTLVRYRDQPEQQATALSLLSARHIVACTDDNDALFARPTLDDARILSPTLTRVAGPSINPAFRAERMADVHSGTLAACLALGMSAERGILLANCAAALATPVSLSARDAIEAAAHDLLTRNQA